MSGAELEGSDLALLEREEFFELNPFAYFIVREGGAIVRVNARFTEATGFDTGELADKQIEDLLSRRNVQELYGYHREKLRYRDRTFEYECDIERKDGEVIRGVITMNIVIAGGKCLGALRDVTEERRLQSALEDRNQELAASSQRLRAAQEELNRATQMATLGEVSGRVAHEILNPLTAITAKTRHIQDSGATIAELMEYLTDTATQVRGHNEEAAEVLVAIGEALSEHKQETGATVEFVLSELGRIQRLVDDMRGATKSAVARVKIQLSELLRYCGDVMADSLEKGGVHYACECPDDLYITADRGELIQVITNMLRNALEALVDLPQERKNIEVAVSSADGRADIRIRDTGDGIPADIALMVFEPNFTTKATGTGLGLAIARRLVRAYDGELSLESPGSPGGGDGAVFLLSMPCTAEQVVEWEG